MAKSIGLTNNTVLITGGASGIGLELAKTLVAMDNTVIICGRSAERLRNAKQLLPQVHTQTCDVSDATQRAALFSEVLQTHPDCNILINNAVVVDYLPIRDERYSADRVAREMHTNFIGPVGLMKLFLDHLVERPNSAIVNITTGLIYVPHATMPGYCASKAALHSYTQSLRWQLKDAPVRVVEVMMTAVDTQFHDGGHVPKMAISTEEAVRLLLKGLRGGKEEIKIGKVGLLSLASRIAPSFAMQQVNRL